MTDFQGLRISQAFLVYAGLVIGVFAVFAQVRNHDFISFDDGPYIYSNEHITTGLKLDNMIYFFSNEHAGNYHPLTSISHMLDVQVFALDPGWHHLSSVLLHALNAAGLFLVLFYMTGSFWSSAFVAAVFAFHPLRVESVAWASERKDVLSAFFWLLTLGAYTYYVRKKGVARYLLAAGSYVLAALSKPMVVTLPFLLLLLDYWPLGRYAAAEGQNSPRRYALRKLCILAGEKIPLFAIAAAESLVTFFIQHRAGLAKSAAEFPFEWRIWNAFYAYARYLGKLFRPVDLAIFYPHPGQSLTWWQVAAAIILLVVVTVIALWQWKKRPYIGVGWFWFLGMLIPVIGLVQVGLQGIADRWTYLPMTGVTIIIAWGAAELVKTGTTRIVAAIGSIAVVAALATLQDRQLGYWENNEALYSHAIDAVDNNWWAYGYLGIELSEQGRYDESVDCFRKSLQIMPDEIDTEFRLGKALACQGKPDEALTVFESFLPQIPAEAAPADFSDELGSHSKTGEIIRIYIESHLSVAGAFEQKGDYDEAIRHYKEVLRIAPEISSVYKALGGIHLQRGNIQEAGNQFARMVELDAQEVSAVDDVRAMLAGRGRPDQAEAIIRKVIEAVPNNADLHGSLGVALGQQAKFDDAVKELEKAVAMDPKSSNFESNLGFALLCQDKPREAIAHFERAAALDPRNETATAHLERTREYLSKQQN